VKNYFFALLVLTLCTAGCVSSKMSTNSRTTAATDKEIKIGNVSDISSLDPHVSFMDINLMAHLLTYGRLYTFGPNKELLPELAQKPMLDLKDKRLWHFKLKSQTVFHNGDAFTKNDVLCSIERIQKYRQQAGGFYGQVSTIDLQRTTQINKLNPDPLHLTIATTVPNYLLPANLASVFIMSCKDVHLSYQINQQDPANEQAQKISPLIHQAMATGKFPINGTNPYVLEAWVPNSFILYRKVSSQPLPWNRIRIFSIPQPHARKQALESGAVDFIISPTTADAIALQHKFNVVSKPSLRLIHIQMHQGNDDRFQDPLHIPLKDAQGVAQPSPFKSIFLRQAFYKAIDKSELVKIMEGAAAPSGQYMPQGTLGHIPGVPVNGFNLQSAREDFYKAATTPEFSFLKKSGLKLVLHATNNRYLNDEKISQNIALQLSRAFENFEIQGQKFSLRVEVRAEPKETYFKNYNKYLFTMLGGGVDNGQGEGALRLYFIPQGSALNNTNYSNPKVTQLYQSAIQQPNEQQRNLMLMQALQETVQDTAFLPLYNQVGVWAMKKNLTLIPNIDEMVNYHEIQSR
jgi:peptide/nickel transport system substrate-binding protein